MSIIRISQDDALRVLAHLQILEDFFNAVQEVQLRDDTPQEDMKNQLSNVSRNCHEKLVGTSRSEGVAQIKRLRTPGEARPNLESISWEQILSGRAAAAKAARAAAFHERVSLSIDESDIAIKPVEAEELVVDFPAHLAGQLCYVSPGSHGWMFAVDKAVAEAFNTTHQSIRSVVRTFQDDGKKYPLGIYKIHRWFEADMYGPEFFQFSEQDQYLVVSRLTNEKFGTSAFKAKEQALVLSQHTVTCLFLQHLPTTPLRESDSSGSQLQSQSLPLVLNSGVSPRSDRTLIPVIDEAACSERISTISLSSSLKTSIPPTSTRRITAPPTSNRGRMYEPQNRMAMPMVKDSPTPNKANARSSYEPPHRITVPVSNGTGSTFNQGSSMPLFYGAPHRIATPALNVNIPIPSLGATASSYEPPPRITVPVLNFTPPTPTLNSTAFVRPFAHSNIPRQDLLYPHRGLLSTGSRPQTTSRYARNGNGPPASISRRSQEHRPGEPVPPMNWDQNDPSSPRGPPAPPRQQCPHNSTLPPPGYHDQQYFHGQRRM